MKEIYLITSGMSIIIVDDKEVELTKGDMIILEPGENILLSIAQMITCIL